jgi:hypothetical protein
MQSEHLLEKGFRHIVEPLRKIVETKREPLKQETKEEEQEENASKIETRWPGRRSNLSSALLRNDDDDDVDEDYDEEVFQTDTTTNVLEDVDANESVAANYEELGEILNNTQQGKEYLDSMGELPRKYINMLVTQGPEMDYVSGVRYNADAQKWMLGIANITFDDNDFTVLDRAYRGSKGLYQLLFLKEPTKFTQLDLSDYKDILKITRAHYQDYGAGRLMVRRGTKYMKVIKNLFPPRNNARRRADTVGGRGYKRISSRKSVLSTVNDKEWKRISATSQPRIEYVRWDSVNELVDRLRLLYAAKMAGNTSVHNEIISIIEELREANVVK